MTTATVIRIEEQANESSEGQPFTASVSFDHGVCYPCQIRDPFADETQQEEELEWYFETYLTFPFTPQVRARNVAASIRTYGISLFNQIFAEPKALLQYRQAIESGLHAIQLEIVGTSSFHRLHWEALHDPDLNLVLALHAPIIRQNRKPQTWTATVQPSTTINILVVVARPAGSRDVGYRTISRPLVEQLTKMKPPINVTLLRPGTYKELAAYLEKVTRDKEKGAGYYHIIHFDVHGGLLTYNEFEQVGTPNRYVYQSRFGRADIAPYEGEKAYLFLESERDERADPVEASEVAHLLLTHHIPIAIINACQSGKYVDKDESSLGSRLIEAGVQTVLAMGYSVTVSAVQLLMPVLYRELLSDTNLSSALCLGRQALSNLKERRAFFNQRIELEDWVLPIVYQNQETHFLIQPMTPTQKTAFYQQKAEQYRPLQPTYGFVGRDVDILHIEKCLLTKRNLLLVRGMGGAGKTTLLHHLAFWWQRTGLIQQVFYFGYDERAWNRQQIMRAIAQKLLGREDFALFQSHSPEAQQAELTQLLYNARHLIILDNLESITGSALAILHTLSKKEQGHLHSFLSELVGGQTLVLLGSRSTEDWLAKGTFDDNRYDLPGLDPEAASQLTERILERHNVTLYQQDSDLPKLIKLLDGFPLALEVVLANLVQQTPTQILTALQTGDVTLKAGDSDKRTENILRCIDYSHSNLSPEAQQLLLCLAPFTSVFFLNALDAYVRQLRQQPTLENLPFDRLGEVVQEAVKWGLLSPDAHNPRFLHLQPVLPYFLRNRFSGEEQQPRRVAVEKAFQDHYRNLSRQLNALIESKEAEEQQIGLVVAQFEYENLLTALRFALREKVSVIDLYTLLSHYLDRRQEQQRGQEIDMQVLQFFEMLPPEDLSVERREEFSRTLALAAMRQRELKQYEKAKKTYQKSLQMLGTVELEANQNHSWLAFVYHQLGILAQAQGKWKEAEEYYEQALQIKVDSNDRYGQASTYGQLGNLAQDQGKWGNAERHYQQVLQIYVDSNDRYEQAGTYHNLGTVVQAQGKWEEAEGYYQQALQIHVEYQDRYSQALTYHQLGRVAQERREWEEAERYYQQALQIKVEYNDRYSQASTYGQLGILALEQEMWEMAGEWLVQSLGIFQEYSDKDNSSRTLYHLARLWQATNDASIPERIASILGTSQEEVEKLLQELLKEE